MDCGMDNETIEAYALGRLRDSTVEEHVQTCGRCQLRVTDFQTWDNFVSRAQKHFTEAFPESDRPKR